MKTELRFPSISQIQSLQQPSLICMSCPFHENICVGTMRFQWLRRLHPPLLFKAVNYQGWCLIIVAGDGSKSGLPVSTAILASSIWHRMWVRILLLSPNLQIFSQSRLDCSDAAGLVNSIYSTPKSDSAWAILILVSVSIEKKKIMKRKSQPRWVFVFKKIVGREYSYQRKHWQIVLYGKTILCGQK